MDEKILDKLKEIVQLNYNSRHCGATEEWSEGNSYDVFLDGEKYGRSWLAYEIGCLLEMELETPEEPKYSWEE